MSGRDLALRLASTLIRRACLHLPASARDEWQQEWAAELPAILDDPAIRSRIRRYTRAVRFAAGQRQAVRGITDPTWPQWLGMGTIRAAASAAMAAVALAVAALALSPAADHAPSDSSPIAVTDIALFLLAVLAGLIWSAPSAGAGTGHGGWPMPRSAAATAGLAGRSSAVRRRAGIAGLARPRLGTARAAAVARLAAVISFAVSLVAGTISEQPFAGSSPLSFLADALEVTGTACLALLAIRALVGAGAWLWHLVHHGPGPRRAAGGGWDGRRAEPDPHRRPPRWSRSGRRVRSARGTSRRPDGPGGDVGTKDCADARMSIGEFGTVVRARFRPRRVCRASSAWAPRRGA
jgi:hypothetical protein